MTPLSRQRVHHHAPAMLTPLCSADPLTPAPPLPLPQVPVEKCGYYEDRRPASNLDPYVVCRLIVETVLLNY